MIKKYEFTGEEKEYNGVKLRRIRALRDFGCVTAGDIGGWIESENNLSLYGDAWVYGEAMVYGEAIVCGNASVYENASVYDNAMVYESARVCGNASVYDNAMVYGFSEVYGEALVYGNARVYGNANVCGDAIVESSSAYTVFKNFWSSNRWITYTHSNKKWKVGCFYGTGEELVEKAYKDSEYKGRCYEALVNMIETIEKEKIRMAIRIQN